MLIGAKLKETKEFDYEYLDNDYINLGLESEDLDLVVNSKTEPENIFFQRKPYFFNIDNFYKNFAVQKSNKESLLDFTNKIEYKIKNPEYKSSTEKKVYNIPFKFRVMNVSLVMGARDFETDIYFTIYDD